MFFSAIKSKISLAMVALAGMTSGFSGIPPPEQIALAPQRRHPKNRALPRSRTPNRQEDWAGRYVHSDVAVTIPWGATGSKLLRKAAEGRLGLYAGRK